MKWTIEKPNTDQLRWIKRFAILPVKLYEKTNGRVVTWVWLEWYYVRQMTHGNFEWSNAGNFPISHIKS